MRSRILVVDDEKEIADLLELYLKNDGFDVIKCYSAREALTHMAETEIDLAILDVLMPETDGFSLCRTIRQSYTWPIIMLTSRVSASDKINGLSLGADDYVTKPFDPIELMARVRAQLRRRRLYDAPTQDPNMIVLPGLTLEPGIRKCTLGERDIDLTPTEFSILCYLCQHRGQTVSSEELFHKVWGDAYYSKSTNPIPVHIRHLREKLEDRAEEPKYIRTVWGVGYTIEI